MIKVSTLFEASAKRRPWRGWAAAALACVGLAMDAKAGGPPQVTVYPERGPCLADAATMRREHPRMLHEQKHRTVVLGERGARVQFTQCISCHASADSHSVVATERDFCRACHDYVAVKLDCFQCHQGTLSVQSAARSGEGR
ncbi:MAG: hypothetical protein WHS85_05905 [Hydrogenophilus sp.]